MIGFASPIFWFILFIVNASVRFGNALQGPMFVEEPPTWMDISNSTGAVLPCKAHGTPAPSIHWLDQADKEVSHIPRLR
ncbi:cell adhesion molecule Dscam1-like [Lycorma delicatula]|uniref:cell adhesion molecule Dscam1-like n=1 Tax=Lycorma delicatula TaxID=130591 RepID=UPI003F50E4BF